MRRSPDWSNQVSIGILPGSHFSIAGNGLAPSVFENHRLLDAAGTGYRGHIGRLRK